MPSTNGPWATGDGMKLASEIGGGLIQMDHVQLHPTAFVDPRNPRSRSKTLAAEALRGVGGILLDETGKRFANELMRRMKVTKAILNHCQPYSARDAPYFEGVGRSELGLQRGEGPGPNMTHTSMPISATLLMSEAMTKEFGPTFGFYSHVLKVFTRYDNASHMATARGFDPETVEETLRRYNEFCAAGNDSDFGRTSSLVPIDPS